MVANGSANGNAGGLASDVKAPATPFANRWEGVERPYSQVDVERLRGSLKIEHSLAVHGANKLWDLMHSEPYVPALGAMSGNQAMQMVRAGLKAIYCSGWQVRACLFQMPLGAGFCTPLQPMADPSQFVSVHAAARKHLRLA